MSYAIRENWYVAQANGIRYPKADHTASTTHAGGALATATNVRITGMQVITDPNVSAAAGTILVTDSAGVTLFTWSVAKSVAAPREFPLPFPVPNGFGINTGAADVGVLATYEVWD